MHPYTVKIKNREVGFKPSSGSINNYYSYDSSKTWDSNPFVFTAAGVNNIYAYPQVGASSDPYVLTISSTIPSRITSGQTTQLVTRNHYAIGLSELSYVGNTKVISNLGDSVSASNGTGVPVVAVNTYTTSYSTPTAVQFFFNIFGQTLAGIAAGNREVTINGHLNYQLIRKSRTGSSIEYLYRNADPERSIDEGWRSNVCTLSKNMGTFDSNDIDICFYVGNGITMPTATAYVYVLRVWTDISGVSSIITSAVISFNGYKDGGIEYALSSSTIDNINAKSHPSYSNKYFLAPLHATGDNNYGNFPLYGES